MIGGGFMKEIGVGRWIRVQSFKHDSKLHRTWDHAMVLEETDDYIVVASKTNRVIESEEQWEVGETLFFETKELEEIWKLLKLLDYLLLINVLAAKKNII